MFLSIPKSIEIYGEQSQRGTLRVFQSFVLRSNYFLVVDLLTYDNIGACTDNYIMESLILAQNERWRRVLSMQVERDCWCLH
jgi:hypothetical protein